jgi:hypothetical protein
MWSERLEALRQEEKTREEVEAARRDDTAAELRAIADAHGRALVRRRDLRFSLSICDKPDRVTTVTGTTRSSAHVDVSSSDGTTHSGTARGSQTYVANVESRSNRECSVIRHEIEVLRGELQALFDRYVKLGGNTYDLTQGSSDNYP